jgi:hypothetical protein
MPAGAAVRSAAGDGEGGLVLFPSQAASVVGDGDPVLLAGPDVGDGDFLVVLLFAGALSGYLTPGLLLCTS